MIDSAYEPPPVVNVPRGWDKPSPQPRRVRAPWWQRLLRRKAKQ